MSTIDRAIVTITSNDPETLLQRLQSNCTASLLTLRRPSKGKSGYDIERVYQHRLLLALRMQCTNYKPSHEEEFFFEEARWPDNLANIYGLWNEPLTFSFENIQLLDLTMDDAVLWLVTILEAIHPSAPLQRLIIRFCEDWDQSALPFPFADLDRLLNGFPNAKLLIAWGWGRNDSFARSFTLRLPILSSKGWIKVLYSNGPNCESSCP